VPHPAPKEKYKFACQNWMQALRYCAWPIIVISVLVAVASVYYTYTHLKIDTSRNALVASNKHLIKLSEGMTRDFGGRDGLVVVAENGHPSRTVKFADDLAAELRHYSDRFPELFYRLDPEILKP
jgi:predicted RND superfamily exporter protein